jgi:hypothetical protein
VPPELRGINDEESFRAVVSCLTEEGETVVERNVFTAPFPATPGGDSKIRTTVELPQPCVAPTVLVLAGSEDKWFAVVASRRRKRSKPSQEQGPGRRSPDGAPRRRCRSAR